MDLGHCLFTRKGARLTATDSNPGYRRLPGFRRGFISSASLWTGPDHLLSVKSDRLRERYKRFYFRDIQAIVITKTPRFHLSTRAAALAAVLLIAILIASRRAPGPAIGLGLLGTGLAGCWIYISAAHSCACRLYTAVSREDLPSLYRTWSARKALVDLERRIAQAQGVLIENWADAAESCSPGPSRLPGDFAAVRRPAAQRTLATDLLLASLFADALVTWFDLGSPSRLLTALSAATAILPLAGAIWILIQHYRGILVTAMQRLAIVTLVFVGGVTYVQQFANSIMAALAGGRAPAFAYSKAIGPVYVAGLLMLGLTGLVLSFRSFKPEPPPAITG